MHYALNTSLERLIMPVNVSCTEERMQAVTASTKTNWGLGILTRNLSLFCKNDILCTQKGALIIESNSKLDLA